LVFASCRQYSTRRYEKRLPSGGGVADIGKSKRIPSLQKHGGVPEEGNGPIDGRKQLRYANPTVVVGIDEREGALVQLESLDRATHGHPQLGIEIAEMEEILTGFEGDLIQTAYSIKLPGVRSHLGCHG